MQDVNVTLSVSDVQVLHHILAGEREAFRAIKDNPESYPEDVEDAETSLTTISVIWRKFTEALPEGHSVKGWKL